MSPSLVQPGTRLGSRYRLEARLDDLVAPNGTHWRAVDEVLQREVGIRTIPADSPQADATLAAAQRAARLTDPRFLRILDANRVDGTVYVVSEWVPGESLATALHNGPLPAGDARHMIAEIAAGLAVAHAEGLSHERLSPEHVLRAEDGQVKVIGLEVEATLKGGRGPDPPAADTRGCGALLYAVLTARWPGDAPTGLPPAPYADGHLCAPRQVRAGVPPALDELACRALGEPLRRGRTPLRTPGELAEALAEGPTAAGTSHTGWIPVQASDDENALPHLSAPARPGTPTLLARTVAVTVLVAGLTLAAWQTALIVFEQGQEPPPVAAPAGSPSPSGSAQASPSGTMIRINSATDFDPEGNGEENHTQVGRAIDGKLDTAWHTRTYFASADLNGAKSGVGLLLDLGSPQPISTVTLDLVGRGTDVELRTAQRVGRGPDDYRLAAQIQGAGSLVTLNLDPKQQARYLLVWLTSLPTETEQRYRGGVSEVTLRR